MNSLCKGGIAFLGFLVLMVVVQHHLPQNPATTVVQPKEGAPVRSLNLVQTGQTIVQTGTGNSTEHANTCACGSCCQSGMCLSGNGMWDDCIGPLAPPDVPNKENKEAAASTSAIKVEKKPEFMTR